MEGTQSGGAVKMSGIQPSLRDNGVVETVLVIAIGVIILGVGAYLSRPGSDVMLWSLGIGGGIALMGSFGFVSRMSGLETRDPVAIVRADLNDWETIRFDFIKLLVSLILFLGFYEFVMVTTSNELPPLMGLSQAPIFVAAFVGVLVLAVLSIMFRSYKGGSRRKGRI
jgi:magnesium-transporting ATPase (P-type)